MPSFQEIITKYNDEYLQFDRVVEKFSNRPDLHAFILLDQLIPSDNDIISCAEHDQIWLDIEIDSLNDVATEEQMIDLVRCGVRYNAGDCSLIMYT